ncbi:MAG TPA: zinc-dependent metalloprotease family protein, partial [Saprospiraceae bacterium]|nr:zinc-dependent metalloprotease family protein [Saprospiraceae bacterium]
MSFRLLLALCALPLALAAQTPHPTALYWTTVKDRDVQAEAADRLIVPLLYRTLRLDLPALRQHLDAAPTEQALTDGTPPLALYLPLPQGGFEAFEVWQAPVMHPDLAARYPQIRTFMGRGLASRHLIVRMDYTPAGFHAMLLGSPGGSVFIEPYARGNTEAYTCYFKKDHPRETPFVCGTHALKGDTLAEPLAQKEAGDCAKLRKYRLALACTGEYAQFHGAVTGNRAPALAAMVTSMNRVNGVFERDASVRMIIVPNDSLIIYTNPATDPYTNNDGPTMLGENQTTCDNVIGSANYDVGHVFSTGGGGIAQLSSPCSSANKAKGVTGRASPVGDYFDIDYVAHEMGHQFAANHTQYNDCNRNNPTAVEPGSASSIMGYAGICAPNVQAHSDDYFHSSSL